MSGSGKWDRAALQARARSSAHRFTDSLLGVVTSPWRAFKALCFTLGLLALLGGTVAGIAAYRFLAGLPDVERMTFTDLRGAAKRHVTESLRNKRSAYRWVPLADVHRQFLYAVVHSEDATFFEHDGVNYEAIVDSLAENLRERKVAYGASTITQQVVKNVFLTSERTFIRKLRELLITWRVETRFTKNEILEVYLNIAEFGPDLFGVFAASRHFFSKSAADTSAAEGAFMALMLPSPRRHYYSIYENRNLSKVKRRRLERVLRDLLYEELITEADYRRFIHYDYFAGAGRSRLPARE